MVKMYSLCGTLFVIFAMVMVSVQMLLSSWEYVYPQAGFITITVISLLFAVYFFLLDHKQQGKK